MRRHAIVIVMQAGRSVGDLLRHWRQRRRISQLDLATDAQISAKHLCFLETDRTQPSRDMLLHLAGYLQIPLRERNVLLHAAGYAPVFPERQLADPALAVIRKAIRPHKVEYTWMSEATQGVESVVSVTFEPRSERTEVTLRHSGVPDDEMDASIRKAGPGSFRCSRNASLHARQFRRRPSCSGNCP